MFRIVVEWPIGSTTGLRHLERKNAQPCSSRFRDTLRPVGVTAISSFDETPVSQAAASEGEPMTNPTRRRVLLGAIVLLFGVANADIQSSKANLKACTDANLASEKAKATPSVDGLLEACSAEYQAFTAELPSAMAEQIKDELRHQLQHALDN